MHMYTRTYTCIDTYICIYTCLCTYCDICVRMVFIDLLIRTYPFMGMCVLPFTCYVFIDR